MSLVTIQTNSPKNVSVVEMETTLKFDFGSVLKRMSDEEFLEFSRRNEGWRVEMNKDGDLEIMPGTGGKTGRRNNRISRRLDEWAEKEGGGVTFNSETVFNLKNGARRMPDASWLSNEKWNSLSETEQEKPIPFAPDFALELRSPSDSIKKLQAKMREYIENGVQIGWLIDPNTKRVYIYRPNAQTEVLENPKEVSGEPLLKGFVLNLQEIWD